MKKLVYALCLLGGLLARPAAAQVGVGGSPDPSAALDVIAKDKAFYPPRLNSTQRQAIPNPKPGALVYDSDKGNLYLYDGQGWLPLGVGDPNVPTAIARTATDGSTYDYFGSVVAISGDYAVVGAPDKTVGTYSKRGGAYVYQRLNGTWTQQALLNPGSSAADQHFGSSVAIAGDYIIVGQDKDGAAYFFQRVGSSWLAAGSVGIGSSTPTGVAISANYAAVIDGGYTSKVYIYQRNASSWKSLVTLTASDAKYGSGFGTIAMNDNDIICGDPYKAAIYGSYTSQEGGEAHVFHRADNTTTWTQQAILRNQGPVGTSLGPKDRDRFGASVDIEGDLAVVGANWRSSSKTEGDGQGAVYFFRRTGSTWKQELILFSNVYPDPAEYGYFGTSVSISNGYVLVGMPSRDTGTIDSQGAAFLYKANSAGVWQLQSLITDTSPAKTYNGSSVGLSGNYYLIGGPGYQINKGKVTFGSIN